VSVPAHKPRSRRAGFSEAAGKKSPLEFRISKNVGRAIADYGMLADGDKVLVAVSGGKDSLALLKILSDRRAFVPIEYELVPLCVDFGDGLTDIKSLRPWVADLGWTLRVEKRRLESRDGAKDCFWCSWNRRKVLFEYARALKCQKLALGHHKDDIIQTVLMNLLFVGEISAMAPRQELFKGKLTLIRPLAYVEEREIEALARQRRFPAPPASCPLSATSQRRAVKKMIEEAEAVCPGVKSNIYRSLSRIRKEYLL
jgi:tRNA 2-thiocytidine biosynthesis protein TtcA